MARGKQLPPGVTLRPTGKKRYRARYKDHDRVEHTEHFDNPDDAEAWLIKEKAALLSGEWVDPRAGKILLRDYAQQWLDARVGSDSTIANSTTAVRRYLIPALGNRPIDAVLRTDIQALVKRLEKDHGLHPHTVGRYYEIIRKVFIAAVDDGVLALARMPCRKIDLPPGVYIEVIPPTTERVIELTGSVPARYRAAVVLLAGSGLRIGELLGLQIGDVDFLRRTVSVRRAVRQRGKNKIGPPKTRRSYRTVPLAQPVLDELAAHIAAHRGAAAARPTDWLFATKGGRSFLSYNGWLDVWKAAQRPSRADRRAVACSFCGAPEGARCRKKSGAGAGGPSHYDHDVRDDAARGRDAVDTHGLRHYFVSCLIAAGASPKLVSSVVGHSSVRITLEVYAHLWAGDDDVVREAMDTALGGFFGELRTSGGPDVRPALVIAGQSG